MRIKPIFSGEDFSQREDRICDLSFEELADHGRSQSIDTKEIERITIRQYPKLVGAPVFYLRKKHQRLQTLGSVQYFATMLGASVIQSNPLVKEIDHLRRLGVESGEVNDILNSFQQSSF